MRITPTEWAEDAYQAKLRQRRPMPVGPAGVPIPEKMAVFRKTIDGPLLKSIATKAYVAWCKRELPDSETARVAEALKRDLLERFPPADMVVLERYGLTEAAGPTFINLATRDPGEKPLWIETAGEFLTPIRANRFSIDMGTRYPMTDHPVPADVEGYCRKVVELRRARRGFDDAVIWPGQFQVAKARWPKWIEIERQFPLIGEWLDGQRPAAGKQGRTARG
jgi:hypothetical protein